MRHRPTPGYTERDLDHQEESLSIELPKRKGESAIHLLDQMKLLNRKLAPRATEDMILLPLIREPTPIEAHELEKALGKQSLAREKFHPRSEAVGSLEEILAQRVPVEIVPLVSKSFDIIGDIAIIELSASAEKFERMIAEALMEVHKSVRTVYSKAGPITTSQRLRPLHLVLGADHSETIHKEHGCRFKVDVLKAFFSPRLSSEHKRVAEQVKPNEAVVDMFAGVGPFSILIAKRLEKVKVHAVEANTEATKLIEENARLNRVLDKITVWSGDAGTVVRKSLSGSADRVIMNHPSEAHRFLEDAGRAIKRSGGTIHYYTFADGEDCETKAKQEFAQGLSNSKWDIERTTTHRVRGVAPMKWQIVVDARVVPVKAR